MASSQTIENPVQTKICRCGDDANIWTAAASDNSADKQSNICSNCQVFRTGPLFISSKGIGWTSWKKRWFVLTRTSLVFFRNDPNAPSQKGVEPNVPLGGIDLNNSGSVVVKADKKFLTLLFPDGREGRAFTIKAETLEDLHEWKIALDNALAQAPNASVAVGQNGMFRNELVDSSEVSFEQWKEKKPVKSLVIGRPIVLALQDIDGSPSFLEKALRFIEEYGINVEGILRQSADVEEVECRVREYEQGKTEFSADEDAHVVGDCIKHVLRELPTSPVPASCCSALVKAYRADRGSRIDVLRAAITETFPEPNLLLVQRILKMMRIVASHKHVNRMSLSALAACMAPLLLRPLLAGDCELQDDFNMGGDGSIQLLQAAAAANHAQAIIIILLEDHGKIFDEDLLQDGSFSSEIYSESEDGDIYDDESTDNDVVEDDGYHDADNNLEEDTEDGHDDDIDHEEDAEDNHECASSGTVDESGSGMESILSQNEEIESHTSNSSACKGHRDFEESHLCTFKSPLSQNKNLEPSSTDTTSLTQDLHIQNLKFNEPAAGVLPPVSTEHKSVSHALSSHVVKSSEKLNQPTPTIKKHTIWGRTPARKNLSMESIEFSSDDETAIKKLEIAKSDLQIKIVKEVNENAKLQENLEWHKEKLHERRLALQQDVERLREQLQRERDLRTSLESGLMNLSSGHLPTSSSMDVKIREDLEEIVVAEADIFDLKQKVADLRGQLSNHLQHGYASLCESCNQQFYSRQRTAKNSQQNLENDPAFHENANLYKIHDLDAVSSDEVQSKMINTHSMRYGGFPEKDRKGSTNRNNIKYSGINCRQFSSRKQNAIPEVDESRCYLSSPHEGPPPKISKDSFGASSSSLSEEPMASRKATSNRTTLLVESKMTEADSVNKTCQTQNTLPTPENRPLGHQEAKISSSNCNNVLEPDNVCLHELDSLGDNATLRNSVDDENVENENEDLASLTNRKPSQKKQPHTANLTSKRSLGPNSISSSQEAPPVQQHSAVPRRLSREEVAASSSSALTRLTNRLNFLKERRVQLVNELQNLDNNHNSTLECPFVQRMNS